MSDNITLQLRCPHCNVEQRYQGLERGKRIITCHVEDGGCDKDYVVDIELHIQYKTFILTSTTHEDEMTYEDEIPL